MTFRFYEAQIIREEVQILNYKIWSFYEKKKKSGK